MDTSSAAGHMGPSQGTTTTQEAAPGEAAPRAGDEGIFLSNLLRQIMPIISQNTEIRSSSAPPEAGSETTDTTIRASSTQVSLFTDSTKMKLGHLFFSQLGESNMKCAILGFLTDHCTYVQGSGEFRWGDLVRSAWRPTITELQTSKGNFLLSPIMSLCAWTNKVSCGVPSIIARNASLFKFRIYDVLRIKNLRYKW